MTRFPDAQDQAAKQDRGKVRWSLLLAHMPRALESVIAVRAYGESKYGTSESWKTVEPERYLEALDTWRSSRSRTARVAVVRRLQAFRLASNGINAAARISAGADGRTTVLVTIPKIPEGGIRRFVVLVEPTVGAPASFTTEFTFTRAPAFRATLDPVRLVTEFPGPTFVSATSE